jgi:RNA polymerase sigma-70 factor, ECF subfamily
MPLRATNFLDYLRRTKVSAADVPIDDAQELAVRDASAHVESSLDLKRLLAELSPQARQAIQYVKLDGLSVSEAADDRECQNRQ